jgi:hypothetical protein
MPAANVLTPRRTMDADNLTVAERVRHLLVQTALEAYEDAALRGLCGEGAWEAAISALRQVDLSNVASRDAAGRRS